MSQSSIKRRIDVQVDAPIVLAKFMKRPRRTLELASFVSPLFHSERHHTQVRIFPV